MFSGSETLSSEYKYYCENCCSKQEATKRLRIKRLPLILALHLKRFKYQEHLHRHTKLSHRVVFPWELKLFNTVREREGRISYCSNASLLVFAKHINYVSVPPYSPPLFASASLSFHHLFLFPFSQTMQVIQTECMTS